MKFFLGQVLIDSLLLEFSSFKNPVSQKDLAQIVRGNSIAAMKINTIYTFVIFLLFFKEIAEKSGKIDEILDFSQKVCLN